MEITLQNVSDVKGMLTVKLVKADYEPKVEKALKAFRQKANIPGFRPLCIVLLLEVCADESLCLVCIELGVVAYYSCALD